MADGTIPAVRIGGQWRISETALERLINGGEGVEGGEGKTEGGWGGRKRRLFSV